MYNSHNNFYHAKYEYLVKDYSPSSIAPTRDMLIYPTPLTQVCLQGSTQPSARFADHTQTIFCNRRFVYQRRWITIREVINTRQSHGLTRSLQGIYPVKHGQRSIFLNMKKVYRCNGLQWGLWFGVRIFNILLCQRYRRLVTDNYSRIPVNCIGYLPEKYANNRNV